MQTQEIEQLIATRNFKLHKANKKVKCVQIQSPMKACLETKIEKQKQ
jgi:hypothetical protein